MHATAIAPGKVNLLLEVGGVQADGYHDLATVFQAVSLYEKVTVTPADDFTVSVSGSVDVSGVPLDATNLAVRAAQLVAGHALWERGAHIGIEKGVPVAGGMGGGSADAAATLVACNELFDAELSPAQLRDLAAHLGADVPFALVGGTAVGAGRGDVVSPALALGRFHWVFVTDAEGLSTPEIYATLDRLRGAEASALPPPRVDPEVLHALRAGDTERLALALHNDLQEAAVSARPALGDLIAEGVDRGALAGIVSGSGPTVAFLCSGVSEARSLQAGFGRDRHEAFVAVGNVAGACGATR